MRLFKRKPKNHEDILDQTLYKLPNTNEKITYADAVEGTLITGATGSGKSSGPGRHIGKAMLKARMGMCILCSKPSEAQYWLDLIQQFAPERMQDVVVLNKKSPLRFNFLAYEISRKGEGAGDVLNTVEALMSLNDLMQVYLSGGAGSKEERFWDLGLRRLDSRGITTLKFAGKEVSIANLRKLVADSFRGNEAESYQALEQLAFDGKTDPVKRQEAKQQLQQWIANNYLLQTVLSIIPETDSEKETMQLLMNYWFREFPKIGERASSIIIESFMGIVEPFLNDGILKSHFSSELSPELLPENCYLKNQIFIIDFPVKEFGVAGIFASAIYKTAFQAAMERRNVAEESNPKPVGLFIDEYQQFCTYKTDVQFQATARSSWVATVYITQNLDGIVNVMSGNQAQERAKSLLGNLNLKFFCSNGNYSTNLWASNMIGKHLVDYENLSISADKKISKTKNQQLLHRIMPDFFTMLKTGRKRNKYKVESIVFKTGRTWGREHSNYALLEFDQK